MSSFPFQTSLNTSTIRPYGLSVVEQIDVAAEAGFAGIELWVRDVEAFRASGGRPADLARRASDRGIEIVNGIAFFAWTDDDPDARSAGIEQARREIDLLARIGCTAVAAPPTGNVASLSLEDIAQNLVLLDKFAEAYGVRVLLEFWGRAPVLNTVHQAKVVLDRSGLVGGALLLDLFHMYTGGSTMDDVAGLTAARVGLVHVNDYPADPPRTSITDADRVMPGDGVGPVGELYRALDRIGYRGFISVELFRPDYGAKSASEVAAEALQKMTGAWEG